MEFKREDYYSQTEVCKKFKISPKNFKQILIENKLDIINNYIILHTAPEGLPYPATASYVLKKDFDNALAIFLS
jgi:hypothetical protein